MLSWAWAAVVVRGERARVAEKQVRVSERATTAVTTRDLPPAPSGLWEPRFSAQKVDSMSAVPHGR